MKPYWDSRVRSASFLCLLVCSFFTITFAGCTKPSSQQSKTEQPRVIKNAAPDMPKGPAWRQRAFAAYIDQSGVVAVDRNAVVLSRISGPQPYDDYLAYNPRRDELYCLRGRRLYRVDWHDSTLRKLFEIPASAREVERDAMVRSSQDFRVLARGNKVCVTYSAGDPVEMEGDEDSRYEAWSYSVDIESGKALAERCPEPIDGQEGVTPKPPLTMSQLSSFCGVRIGGQSFPMAPKSKRNGGGCDLTLFPTSPSGRYQIVSALRGGDDALQITYVLYMVDLEQATLVPLRKYFPEEWTEKPPSADFAVEVIIDASDAPVAPPVQWAKGRDVFYINGVMVDLEQTQARATKLPRGAVLILP